MKWQPIETAPTDGTRILLRGRSGKIADGHYGQPDGYANPKRFVWPYINATPTHWAPLAFIDAAAGMTTDEGAAMTDRISTHADGCWDWGPKHYECAVGKIEQLEERVQRDEALLRQALEVLSRAQTAMEQTLRARVPECSAFAGIAQDLDFVVAALRERLGEKA